MQSKTPNKHPRACGDRRSYEYHSSWGHNHSAKTTRESSCENCHVDRMCGTKWFLCRYETDLARYSQVPVSTSKLSFVMMSFAKYELSSKDSSEKFDKTTIQTWYVCGTGDLKMWSSLGADAFLLDDRNWVTQTKYKSSLAIFLHFNFFIIKCPCFNLANK